MPIPARQNTRLPDNPTLCTPPPFLHPTCLPSEPTLTNYNRTTNSDGQTITSTVLETTSMPIATGAVANRSSSSNVGPIVGGVVGGVVGAALLATLVFLLCRRRRRDDFDGNFDPDRVVGVNHGAGQGGTLPDIDLAAAGEVTPYSYTPGGAMAPGSTAGDMRQYGGVPAFLAGGVAGAGLGAAAAHRSQTHSNSPPPQSLSGYSYPQSHSAYSHSSFDPLQQQQPYPPQPYPQSHSTASPTSPTFPVAAVPGRDFRQPSPGPSLAYTGSDHSPGGSSAHPGSGQGLGMGGMGMAGVIPSAKEREAMGGGRRSGMFVANADSHAGPGVMQHQDGGRVRESHAEEEEPNEIPPSYDMIRRDS